MDLNATNINIKYKDGYNILIYKIYTNKNNYELENIQLQFLHLKAKAKNGVIDKSNNILHLKNKMLINLNDWHLIASKFALELNSCNYLYGTDLTITKNNIVRITAKKFNSNIETQILNLEGEIEATIKLPNN